MRNDQRWKSQVLHDRHLSRHGIRIRDNIKLTKGGAGKANWGTVEEELDDLDVRVGSPFEDGENLVSIIQPNVKEVIEPKVRLMSPTSTSVEEEAMTAH